TPFPTPAIPIAAATAPPVLSLSLRSSDPPAAPARRSTDHGRSLRERWPDDHIIASTSMLCTSRKGSRGEGYFFSFPVDSFTTVTVETTTLFAEMSKPRLYSPESSSS
ncbi:unnamed protein product, partial [Urochloa humidicola]